jgi:predicted ATPase/DNA-binding CsgD family transcriptional regulator
VQSSTPNTTNVQLPPGMATVLVAEAELPKHFADEDPALAVRAGLQCASVLGDAIARHGGVTPNTADATIAAFGRASDALAAAIHAQRALALQAWPTAQPIRVGIALHTAEARPGEDGNHLGGAVERCARMRAIAHGGQTIMSRTTEDLVAERLPDGVTLADLGAHRLRDLGRPEQIFSAHADGLQLEFPALRSLSAWPNNLPEQFTSFVGRERELEHVRAELSGGRLVVLTGAGGAGKTRLALQAAADGLERYEDGVWCVELAPVADSELLGAALADAVGARPTSAATALAAAIEHLGDGRALVLLDNCEHLLAPAAAACEELLAGCPHITVLATSRAALGLPDELDWRVPPLSLPAEHAPEPLEALAPSDAVTLFIERARAATPGFSIDEENAPPIAQICHDLDGIPLALELAAARTRAMSARQIADGLTDRFRLLTGGARTLMPRQQTLRASVDWSYELLAEDEQQLLARLAVFAGGCSPEAVQAVCGAAARTSGRLESLVGKSLALAEEHDGEVRYRLLQTVREYGLDILRETGQLDSIRDRHLTYYLALAQSIAPQLLSPDQRALMSRLDTDAANFDAAAAHAVDADPERALSLCEALAWWWAGRGLAAGELALGRALAAADPKPSMLRARATYARSMIARQTGEFAACHALATEAAAMAESFGDTTTVARSLLTLATIQLHADPAASRPMLARVVELAREAGDDWSLAHGICSQAWSHVVADDFSEAERLLNEGLPFAHRIGAEALAYYWVGFEWCAEARGDAARTFRFGELAVAAAREVAASLTEGLAHLFMGWIELGQDHPHEALERLRASDQRLIAAGAEMGTPQTRAAIAAALAADDLDAARQLLDQVIAGGADGGYNLALAFTVLANVQRASGDVGGASDSASQALELGERVRSPFLTSGAREALGRVAALRLQFADAEALLHASLSERVDHDLRLWQPQTIDALALVAAGHQSFEEAARLLGVARGMRADTGLVRWPWDRPEIEELARNLSDALGQDAYETVLEEGSRMPREEALSWIQRSRGGRKRPPSGWASLTPTELQVVKLVSEGLTNPQVAERMFISRATVKVHLGHVFQKLDVHSRSELAAQSARREAAAALEK